MADQLTVPTHLWVGAPDQTRAYIVTLMQQYACAQKGCAHCVTCRSIAQEQYHSALWLAPEVRYTLAQFDPMFQAVSFGLDTGAYFFVVIQKADTLSAACANSILKLLEEPPTGYYFFLTAERLDDLLPTIRSRCVIHTIVRDTHHVTHQDLFAFFTSPKGFNPAAFSQELYRSNITEREALDLVDALSLFWMEQYKKGVSGTGEHAQERVALADRILSRIRTAYMQPPMPGSSKLFLRDLYLQIKGI